MAYALISTPTLSPPKPPNPDLNLNLNLNLNINLNLNHNRNLILNPKTLLSPITLIL